MSGIKKAVAIKYPEGCDVPFISAKGKGELAEIILREAEKNNIKVCQDTLLVDLLDTQEIGQAIPEAAWKSVAEIFSFILKFEKK